MAVSLKDARLLAGKISQTALAEMAGTGRSTIVKLEQGVLPLTEDWARRLAPHLGLRPEKLFDPNPIPIVGYVGAGARVYPYDDLLNVGDTIPRPPMTHGEVIGLEVKGDSMLPLAEVGWYIVYTEEATIVEHEVLNRLCVVQLAEDGAILVKRVLRGSQPFRYHLSSLNAPLIEDVELRWAAVVKAIVPR